MNYARMYLRIENHALTGRQPGYGAELGDTGGLLFRLRGAESLGKDLQRMQMTLRVHQLVYCCPPSGLAIGHSAGGGMLGEPVEVRSNLQFITDLWSKRHGHILENRSGRAPGQK
ncbi:MAG TPA: hypothetical protein PLV53_06490 [Anaerolineaceae bacterium]|nr:hypothetical protein [Anaerolineaceae bacterium]